MVRVHLSLNVSDLDCSVAFYEAFLGTPPHKRRPDYANFDLADPPLKLALNQVPERAAGNALDHLELQCTTGEQVQAARERLEASGLVSFDEGDTVCCYARQDKVWVQDPDSNREEVYVLLDDLLSEREKAGRAFAIIGEQACCGAEDCAS